MIADNVENETAITRDECLNVNWHLSPEDARKWLAGLKGV
jgi:hypothetical protein